MSQGGEQRGLGGALGELFPVAAAPEPLPREPVHARVLESHAGGERALVFASFDAAESAVALHHAARPRVEAALLAELACPPASAPDMSLRALRFHFFEATEGAGRALEAFGFSRTASLEGLSDELARLRAEAQLAGVVRDDDPVETYVARAAPAGLDEVEARLRHAVGEEVFGERPGAFAARLGRALGDRLPAGFEPSFGGLDRLEGALFAPAPGALRLLPQATFQALCDAVALVAHRAGGRAVEWAESRPDESGLAPPPLVRVKQADGFVHLPLGLHLLRWCVMPRRAGEEVPSVSEWLRDQLSI